MIVPDNQLSLAIGKEGQNARLSAKITGWKIDICSETQIAQQRLSSLGLGTIEEEPSAETDSGKGTEKPVEAAAQPAEQAGPAEVEEALPEGPEEKGGDSDGQTT